MTVIRILRTNLPSCLDFILNSSCNHPLRPNDNIGAQQTTCVFDLFLLFQGEPGLIGLSGKIGFPGEEVKYFQKFFLF